MKGISLLIVAIGLAGCTAPDEPHTRQIGLTPLTSAERFVELSQEELQSREFAPIQRALREDSRYTPATAPEVDALMEALREKWRTKYAEDGPGAHIVRVEGQLYELNYVS